MTRTIIILLIFTAELFAGSAKADNSCQSVFRKMSPIESTVGRFRTFAVNRKIVAQENARAGQFIDNEQPISGRIHVYNNDLPDAAQRHLSKLRLRLSETRYDKPKIFKWNFHTIHTTSPFISSAFPADPAMAAALAQAFTALSNKAAIADYVEDLAAETFRTMLSSGSAKFVADAMKGRIDHETIVAVLIARHRARGLEPAVIEPNSGLLTKNQWLRTVSTGPLIDRGFVGASDIFNTHHGIYIHLFQLDYLMPLLEKGVPPGQLKKYFDFFGTEAGFAYWVEAFDIYGGEILEFSMSRSLRDSYFVNNTLFGADLLNLKDPEEYASARRLETAPRGSRLTRRYHQIRQFQGGLPNAAPDSAP